MDLNAVVSALLDYMKQFGKVAAEGTVEKRRLCLRAFARTVELDPETGKGRPEIYSLPVMAAVQEKKDSPESRPFSLTLVAGEGCDTDSPNLEGEKVELAALAAATA